MLRSLIIAISLLVLGGCDALNPGVLYVDPAIDLSGYDGGFVIEGDPHLEMGFYIEQLYQPLDDGEPCYVAWGLQGGTWTMPALRTKGIGTPATVSCTMVTETGELVSEVVSKSQLYLTPDRYLEIQAYPIPVHHPAPNEQEPIDDLYGLTATLECEVKDEDGRAKSVVYDVEIVEG
ncbi:MAG: hypothetical protein VX938_02080 [Myxococcota bacterium]|nr:hypothetical protein [Myxococcota bacterium]